MTTDIIALIANVALSLSFIVGLIFGIAQVRAAARDRRERLTLEAMRNFQTREFTELMLFVNAHEMPPTREAMMTLSLADRAMFTQFAQEMEMLGILVAERFIDLDLVDKTLGSFVSNSWKKYEAVTLHLRESLPDPFLSEYFQWLAERIQKRMKDHLRKPFYQTR
jgi:hypothetical protein